MEQLVRALDNGEHWAQKKINEMWNCNDPTLIQRMAAARVKIYRAAAMQGDEKALLIYGVAIGYQDKNESLRILGKLADKGNVEAMKEIAHGYSGFSCFEKNYSEYFNWYLRAAEAGDSEAQAKIALEYSNQGKINKKYEWSKKSAEQGNAKGKLLLADVYNAIGNDLNRKKYHKEYYSTDRLQSSESLVGLFDGRLEELMTLEENERIDVLNISKAKHDGFTFSTTASALANLYLHPFNPNVEPDPLLAAEFYYRSYIADPDNHYSLENCQKTIQENSLIVSDEDFERWSDL